MRAAAFSGSTGPRSLIARSALAHIGRVEASSEILDVRKSHSKFPGSSQTKHVSWSLLISNGNLNMGFRADTWGHVLCWVVTVFCGVDSRTSARKESAVVH